VRVANANERVEKSLEQRSFKTILPHSEPKERASAELVMGDEGCVQHTQTEKPTDSPSTQYMYSDGIHPVESILIESQYML